MKTKYSLILLGMAATLGGCATEGPATGGASVRAIVARQIANPHPQRGPAMVDGASAVSAINSYADSYARPQPQRDGSSFDN